MVHNNFVFYTVVKNVFIILLPLLVPGP